MKKILVIVLLFVGNSLFAQDAKNLIPDEYRGNTEWVARGIMDGNLIETNYRNHGELSRWSDIPWGVWPRGIGGRHVDGIAIVIAGNVFLASGSRIILSASISVLNKDSLTCSRYLSDVTIIGFLNNCPLIFCNCTNAFLGELSKCHPYFLERISNIIGYTINTGIIISTALLLASSAVYLKIAS